MAEPGIFLVGPIEYSGADGPALGNDRQIAFGRHTCGKAGVELLAGADDAQAVGADDPQSRALGRGQDPLFDQAAFFPQFPTAGRDDNHPFGPGPHALTDNFRGRGNGCGDDGQVGRRFYLGDRAVGFEPVDQRMIGVDRDDGSGKTTQNQIVDQSGSKGTLSVVGADNRDAFGIKELFHG